MQDFYGSKSAVTAQKRLCDMHPEIAANPALSNGGRILNILDLEAVGLEAVEAYASHFGYSSVTAVPINGTLERVRAHFGDRAGTDVWLAIIGQVDTVVTACRAIIEGFEIPAGWRLAHLDCPNDTEVEQIADLSLSCGVAPSPTYYIRSEVLPHLTACLWDDTGALVATAAASQRYHPDSRFGDTAFAGSVAVSPDHRRMGLGKVLNASVLLQSQMAFGWQRVLEQARPDNDASRGMIRACGLKEDPDLGTIAVNLVGEFLTR